jgi:hypothetical protein
MSKDEQKQAIAASLIVAFIVWVLWHLFNSGSSDSNFEEPTLGTPTAYPDLGLQSPVIPSQPTTDSCDCNSCSACSVSPYVIADINAIIANEVAFTNAIFKAGNDTLEAIAEIEGNANNLVQVTVG